MLIFDKAAWQIDVGVPEELVVSHFRTVFLWLEKHDMLSAEGKEELEDVSVENAAIVSIAEIEQLDSSICELCDLPLEYGAFRDEETQQWKWFEIE